MNKDFSHLTPTQLIELRDRYYAGEVVKELEKEYDLSFPLSSRVSNFPPIQYHDRLCPYCAIPMISTCRIIEYIRIWKHFFECKSASKCSINCSNGTISGIHCADDIHI